MKRGSEPVASTTACPEPAPRLAGMETFFVVVMALVILGVGVLALVAVRRLSVLTADETAKDD